jgi:tetratricopeptide (TPR) repeat protein
MNPNHQRIDSIFLAAAEKATADERAAYLDVACGADAELRERVERLLAAQSKVSRFLEAPAPALIGTVDEPPVTERPGLVIGPYKLLEPIGEGGMGTVWMAEQTEPIQRRVALKVVKEGMDSRQVLARFEAERQALALMDHPNIAKVLDAGRTPSARPYFVMELVKGRPITQFCDEKRLGVRERLGLCADVCRAVQHAHQKGIIHRDLKPSNVLVAPYDGRPVVKVIDFGVAKATGQRLTDQTLFTGFGALVGTPEYMSPEQAEVNNQDIDTRSDVYSLGVLLYELLTGTTPLTRQRVKEAALLEVLRVIREEEPPRPSTRLSTTDELPSIAANRGLEPRKLSGVVRGDLDWIVMKALEKDRSRRYESAGAFTADVLRYLRDEPVLACPPSAWYRWRKFARRNQAPLAVAACLFLVFAILGGSIVWAWRDRAAREREESARQAEVARRAEEAVSAVRTYLAGNNLALARQKLAGARAHVGQEPASFGDLIREIESIEEELKRFDRYLDLLDQAHQAEIPHSSVEVPGDPTQPSSRPWQPAPAKAVPYLLEALALYSILEREDWTTALQGGVLGKGQVEQIRGSAYEELLWLATDVLDRKQDHRSGNTLPAEAAATQALGYLHKAEVVRRPTRAFYAVRGASRNLLGEREAARADGQRASNTPPTTAVDHMLHGRAAFAASQRAAANKKMDTAVREKNRAVAEFEAALRLEPTHYWSLMRLGYCLASLGKAPDDWRAASTVFTACISKRPNHAHAYQCRADVYNRLGRYEYALADSSRAIELDPKHLLAWNTRGDIYFKLRQYDRAIVEYSAAIAVDPKDAEAWFLRARTYSHAGKSEEAIADYAQGLKLDPKDTKAWVNRGTTYLERRQYEQGIADLSKAIELDKTLALAWNNRADAYFALRQFQKAVDDYSKAIKLTPKWMMPVANRGMSYLRLRQYKEAAADFTSAITLNPKDARQWCNRGIAYRELRQYELAIKDLCEGLKLDPKYTQGWYSRGLAYMQLHQCAKAIDDFTEAIKLDPKLYPAWGNRAGAHYELHHYQQAITDYREAIRLQDRDPHAYACMAWLRATAADPRYRDPVEALQMAKQSVRLGPREASYWTALGIAHVRAGEGQEALVALDKAMKLSQGGDGADWFIVALAHWQLGDKPEARKWYDRAAAWMTTNKEAIEANKQQADVLRGLAAEAAQLFEMKQGQVGR